MKKIIIAMGALLMFASVSHARTKLAIHQGSMSAGGSLAMTVTKPADADGLIGMRLAPEFSFFVLKGLSLGLTTHFEKLSFSHDIPWDIAVGLGLKYHIDLGGAIYPYFGGEIMIAVPRKDNEMRFAIKVPIGILVPINTQVAFNIGVPLSFIFKGSTYEQMKIEVGYLGMVAFF